jgi:hypothetical protein
MPKKKIQGTEEENIIDPATFEQHDDEGEDDEVTPEIVDSAVAPEEEDHSFDESEIYGEEPEQW